MDMMRYLPGLSEEVECASPVLVEDQSDEAAIGITAQHIPHMQSSLCIRVSSVCCLFR